MPGPATPRCFSATLRKQAFKRHGKVGGMNYNNFSCRLVAPRSPAVVRSGMPPKSEPKKERKPPVSRRLASAASVAAVMLGLFFTAASSASARPLDLDQPTTLRLVPAAQTVAFTGATGHLSLDIPVESPAAESDLASQLEAFSAQVSALTSQPFPSVRPAAMHLSALTGVLLCAGLGVSIVRATLLFHPDLTC
jgi:hypothetical protein